MRLGYFNLMHDRHMSAGALGATARCVEEAGLDSFWVGEHVVLPSPRVPPSPMDPDHPILDPVVTLAHVAALTSRLRLATGILILPQRNPVVLAKQIASLDVLSGGRVSLGIGVGYLETEYEAIGADYSRRGQIADEYLAAMSALWYDERPSFSGAHVAFTGIDAHPRPVQRPIPVVVGGNSPAAFRRAHECGDAWYGFSLAPDQVERSLVLLESVRGTVDRAPDRGPLEIIVTPPGRLTPERAAAYADVGVDELVVLPNPRSDDTAATLAGARRAVDSALG